MPKESFSSAVLKKPGRVFVDFGASWCPPCQWFKPTVGKLIAAGIPVHEIDVDEHHDLTSEYQVMSVPTMILFEDGKPIWSFTGVKTYDDLRKIYEA